MPKKGYESITIPELIYRIAAKKAEKDKRSVANYVSKLIQEDKT